MNENLRLKEVLKVLDKNNVIIPTTCIETGSFYGNGIQTLLNSSKFNKIYSIEIYDKYFDICSNRFSAEIKNNKLSLLLGSSSTEIESAIKDKCIFFWLDAHCKNGNVNNNNEYPLEKELEIIFKSNLDYIVIAIDDIGKSHCRKEYKFVFIKDVLKKNGFKFIELTKKENPHNVKCVVLCYKVSHF